MSSFIFNPGYENRLREFATTQPRNLNTSHPLIPSGQEYMIYYKYVSIHSEDRDIINYPTSSEFEIELPEDIVNVSTIRLSQWTFPANYNTFSAANNNTLFSFTIKKPYNPSIHGVSDVLTYRIFEALFYNENDRYDLLVEEGFYNPEQIAREMTNKMNSAVTFKIERYFLEKGSTDPSWIETLKQFKIEGGYTRFVVVYNNVSCKLWFGNRADGFTLLNEVGLVENVLSQTLCIGEKKHLPDFSNYGLPGYLGLPRCNTISQSSSDFVNITNFVTYNGIIVPRFYYGDVFSGDDGYWLLPYPDLSGSEVYWVESINKINLMGESYIYMELAGQNCIDETKPYNLNNFTFTTNQTNGIVDAAFAKIPVPTTPMSQWFDRDSVPYKFYYPPAERIRRLKIKLRYHNGQIVSFGNFNYSFTLEFAILLPMILRDSNTRRYPPLT
jgi:hypothetical protein